MYTLRERDGTLGCHLESFRLGTPDSELTVLKGEHLIRLTRENSPGNVTARITTRPTF